MCVAYMRSNNANDIWSYNASNGSNGGSDTHQNTCKVWTQIQGVDCDTGHALECGGNGEQNHNE